MLIVGRLARMKIPKFWRHLIQLVLFALLAFALLHIPALLPKSLAIVMLVLAVPLAYFGALFLSFYVDKVDWWLRRRSRDKIWLMTGEGKKWLASEDGQRWQKERVS